MKNWFVSYFVAVILFWRCAIAIAQVPTSANAANGYSIANRSPFSRVWQRLWLRTNETRMVRTNIQSYTEMRSGLCHLAGGVWADSSDEIDLVADGAQAAHGQHQAHWAANANAPGGALRLVTASGTVLQSGVFGVSYWDASSDTNLLIGGIQDAQGSLVGNQVIYENAFQGNMIKADIAYTYTVEGLEQNIVFREQLPNPATFDLDPNQTYVQVLTEFFNPPAPATQSAQFGGVTNDTFLNFGDMSIGIGQAFLATNEGGAVTAGPVQKQWVTIENRQFLIEQIPFSQIAALQTALPQHASIARPSKKVTRLAALHARPTLKRPRDFGALKLAAAYSAKPGLVMDYNLVNVATNVTFQGDTTYYVSGGITIYGTSTFEGGAVIKFTNNGSISIATSPQTPQLNFLTGPYRPVVFTAKDDNSVGQTIAGSTGNPSTNFYGNPALGYGSITSAIANIRISYASQAVVAAPSSTVAISDLQIVNCSNGVAVTGGGLTTIRNALFANVGTAFNSVQNGATVNAENITVSGNKYLAAYGTTNGVSMTFTNCIFSDVTYLTNTPYALSGCNNGFYASPAFGSAIIAAASYPFQTVGAGGFYLAGGCPFLNAAAVNVDAAILSDLALKTVYPPLTVNGWVTNNLTLFPQAQRDTGVPSLGYHYDPIDWAGSIALSNATLTVLPGTAIAAAGVEYGLVPYTTSTVSFEGTATAPIHFVRYNTVQEQSNTNWETSSWADTFLTPWSCTSPCNAEFQFTDWSVLAGDRHVDTYGPGCMNAFGFQNCQFYSGGFAIESPAVGVTNCLFRRVAAYLDDGNGGSSPYFFYNNLFAGGSLQNYQFDNGVWTFKDNLFDTVSLTPPLLGDVCNYNAYTSTNTLTSPAGANDIILSNSPVYQSGFLGQYYYPTTLTNLIHQGSRLASAAGLYHYTVNTNQAVEGVNQVSIGFHYVATDGSGNPLDSNGDGVADYIEDANGNGLVDSGEMGWNLAGDLGLNVVITQPMNHSRIP